MYGTKARIGVLVPSVNTVTEAEFNALVPEGITMHSARMFITHPTVETLARMNEDIEVAAKLIATMEPTAVAFACTAGSLLEGVGYDTQLIQRIQRIVKVPTTTTATAVIQAFKELGIQKVSVGTPYNEELTHLEKEFFEKSGIRVLKIKGLNFQRNEWHQMYLDRVKKLAREVNHPDAEAIFLSCTNMKTLPVIGELEEELGKYVFSSNVATFWHVMRLMEIKENIRGEGKLLGKIHQI
jgi:maleate cis-trans isomerase